MKIILLSLCSIFFSKQLFTFQPLDALDFQGQSEFKLHTKIQTVNPNTIANSQCILCMDDWLILWHPLWSIIVWLPTLCLGNQLGSHWFSFSPILQCSQLSMGQPASRRFSRSRSVVVLWKKDLAKAKEVRQSSTRRRFSQSRSVVVLHKKDFGKAEAVWQSSTSQSQSVVVLHKKDLSQSWRSVWQSSTRRRFSQSPSVVVLHKKDLSQKLRKCGSLAQEGLAQAELEVWQFLSLRRFGQILAM